MANSKTCIDCGIEHPVNSFYKKRNNIGKQYLSSRCMDCTRVKAKKDYRRQEDERIRLGLSRSEISCAKKYKGGPWQTLQNDIQMAKLSIPL